MFRASLPSLQRLALTRPSSAKAQTELAGAHYGIGLMERSIGDHARARRSFTTALAILDRLDSSRPGDIYDRARLLALISERPGSDRERQFAGDRAMGVLRQTVSAGFRDVARMVQDHDLDALHTRLDFQLLMMDLAFPAEPFVQDTSPHQ
jgi:eukaryotic-like serine/threonine-protein kinase